MATIELWRNHQTDTSESVSPIIESRAEEKGRKKLKNGGVPRALTLEGRGNDLVWLFLVAFCCSQVFSVLYCQYQHGNVLIFV